MKKNEKLKKNKSKKKEKKEDKDKKAGEKKEDELEQSKEGDAKDEAIKKFGKFYGKSSLLLFSYGTNKINHLFCFKY